MQSDCDIFQKYVSQNTCVYILQKKYLQNIYYGWLNFNYWSIDQSIDVINVTNNSQNLT